MKYAPETSLKKGDNPTKITPIITALLIVSVCVNIFFLTFYVPSDQGRLSDMSGRLNALSDGKYPAPVAGEPVRSGRNQGTGVTASLQAPAVTQSVQNVVRGRHVAQTVVQKGSIMNISVEIVAGKGRVLVQTKPLMGVDFQGAANTAVAVAGTRTGADLSKSDVIFSIDSGSQISEVDGPSAGALMTLLAISAIEKRPIDSSLTLTGTINPDGSIGAIGGVVEKATAAKESGKTLFLVPMDNQSHRAANLGQSGGLLNSPVAAAGLCQRLYREERRHQRRLREHDR